jgi:hypothetical protein
MTSYDEPRRERYSLLGSAFGSGTVSRTFQGPPGKQGLVRDIVIDVTTAMVGTTSVPEMRVGTAASDNSFARWLLGTSATAGYGTGEFRARSLCQNAQGRTGSKAMQLNDFAHHIALEGNDGSGTVGQAADANGFAYLPADTAFFITGVAGVGGTPAGTADVYVDIDWF